jgi:hypothetical protein
MAWRFTYPNIDGSSEKIADFSYICSYYTGLTLPVPDAWFYPYLSTQYYSFQHYGAALMGRVLLLPPGSAYNIGYCLLIALGGTAFAGAVFMVARKAWTRPMVVACFVIGGHRDHPPRPLHRQERHAVDHHALHRQRADGQAAGRHLAQGLPAEVPGPRATGNRSRWSCRGRSTPTSSSSGTTTPRSRAITCSGSARWRCCSGRARARPATRHRRGTLTWTLLANTWVLPLQGLAVVHVAGVNWRDWRRLVPAVAVGAAAVWLAAWVYLSAFTSAAAGYDTAVRMVPWAEHTPPLLFMLFFLPTIAFILLGFASGTPQGRRLALFWLAFLLFSEFFYVDDEYTGHYDRFNTTLKWWPWVMAGTLMTLAPVVLEQARRRWVRIAAIVFCLYPCCYVYDLWEPMWNGPEGLDGQDRGDLLPDEGRVPPAHARPPQGREARRRHREARRAGRIRQLRRHPALRGPEDVARLVGPRAALAGEPRGRARATTC